MALHSMNVLEPPFRSNEDRFHGGLILKPKAPEHWELGSGKATERFGGGDINPKGDWTPYKAADEAQSRPDFDTNGCAVFATLKAWIMLAKFYGFDDFPKDCSERYSGALGGTTRTGTDPHEFAEITRNFSGVIPGEVLPWTDDIETYEEYYSKLSAIWNLPLGKQLLRHFELGHEWLFAWGSTYSPKEKTDILKVGLRRGTVCVSVDGMYEFSKNALVKHPGIRDSHWVDLLRFDGNNGVIHDQYPDFEKKLQVNYDHDAAKVYFLKRREVPLSNDFWEFIYQNFTKKSLAR